MEEQIPFGERYRSWVCAYTLEQSRADAVWQGILKRLAHSRRPLPVQTAAGRGFPAENEPGGNEEP